MSATDSLIAWLDAHPDEDREEHLVKALRDAEEWLSCGVSEWNNERAIDSIRRYREDV